jgi:hypothetical protein
VETKRCKKCGAEKSLVDEFFKHPQMKDGHLNVCKSCHIAAGEARRKADPEKDRKRRAAWRAAHPEEWEARKRQNEERRKANPDRDKDLHAAWRAAHPEEIKAIRKRAYEKSLKNGMATKSRVTRQARVKAATTGPVVSLKGILERDGMHCFICNKSIENELQLTYDHTIPLARGGTHSEDNLHPAHKSCNSWKCDRLPDELVGLVPPEPGQVTDEEAYHIKKVNEAKSASHKRRLAEMPPEQKAERQAHIDAGVTAETIAKRRASAQRTWASKTPEEREAWRARCREIKKGSSGNIENLKKGWSSEAHEKAIQASADLRRGTTETDEHKSAIYEGLRLAYAEGRRRREHTEETKLKISETKKLQNAEARSSDTSS